MRGSAVTYWNDRIDLAHRTKKRGEIVISKIRPTVHHSRGIFDEDQGGQVVPLMEGLEEALWR
jgi:hypothetical protein